MNKTEYQKIKGKKKKSQAVCPKCGTVYRFKEVVAVYRCLICGYKKLKEDK